MSTFDGSLGDLSGRLVTWAGHRIERWQWLVPGLLAGIVVYLSYLQAHPYPAFGAGLYLQMADALVETFPDIPATIAHYTASGVPFAYPPLLFAVTGALVSVVGVDPVEFTRHLPSLVSVLALVPFYLFAEELLDSRRQAGLATVLSATAPPLLQWQLSAGGIVRAPAYLFTLVGLYAGLKLFRTAEPRWLALAVATFTLTVLSHPVYTAFFGLSYVVMWASFDASLDGLGRGATVALGGAVLSVPWWGQVVATHGVQVLTGAAGTHGGIGKQIPRLLAMAADQGSRHSQAVLFSIQPELFEFDTVGMWVITGWSLLVVAALVVSVDRSWPFLPAWFIVTILFVSKPRFTFLIGSLLLAAAGPPVVDRLLGSVVNDGRRRARLGVALAAILMVAATATGALYAGSHLDSHAGSTSLPQFVHEDSVEAMEWAAANTDRDATFVVVGDAAEWFPYITNRTILVGPWGVEWEGNAAYERQLNAFNSLSTCPNASCLDATIRQTGERPDYLYVPRGRYTVRGMEMTPDPALHESLREDDRYRLVHRNRRVAIYETQARCPVTSSGDGETTPELAGAYAPNSTGRPTPGHLSPGQSSPARCVPLDGAVEPAIAPPGVSPV